MTPLFAGIELAARIEAVAQRDPDLGAQWNVPVPEQLGHGHTKEALGGDF